MIEKVCIEMLPNVKGTYTPHAPLAPYTTLKIGGPADVLFEPADVEDLITFWKNKPSDVPCFVLGEGSNLLIKDGGISGVVVRLGASISDVVVEGHLIHAYAGATSGKVSRVAREHGLAGVEFLCGIPGSIGGALKMNAGAYGQETSDFLASVDILMPSGQIETVVPEKLDFAYRQSHLPEGCLFLKATFSLKKGDKSQIKEKMRSINKNRISSQPLNKPSSGSWFKNPKREDLGLTNAWQAVDAVACRGVSVGGAQVSEKHANFFINTGDATAEDMLALTALVEEKIEKKFGITMVKEVKIVGRD